MCLVLFAFQQHPDYPLIVAANRDEFYQRPTAAAHFWQQSPTLFAGRDLQAGGTWMGITRSGRFAALTNYREATASPTNALSRGQLCSDFLNTALSPLDYLEQVDQQKDQFAGFNLLLGNTEQLFCYSNMHSQILDIEPGIHGLSNGRLNEPWPKVEQGKQALSNKLSRSANPEDLLSILLDAQRPDDEQLPNTGIDLETERLLSSRFIHSEHYGTRNATVLRIDTDNNAQWLEQSFDKHGPSSKRTLHHIPYATSDTPR